MTEQNVPQLCPFPCPPRAVRHAPASLTAGIFQPSSLLQSAREDFILVESALLKLAGFTKLHWLPYFALQLEQMDFSADQEAKWLSFVLHDAEPP